MANGTGSHVGHPCGCAALGPAFGREMLHVITKRAHTPHFWLFNGRLPERSDTDSPTMGNLSGLMRHAFPWLAGSNPCDAGSEEFE